MELSKLLGKEKRERARRRREEILQNKYTKEQLDEILLSDSDLISARNDKKDKSSIKIWSKTLNKNFLALPRVVGDRDPTTQRVNGLKLKIGSCRLPFSWYTAFNEEDGLSYRINGNTTATIASLYPELFQGATIYWTEFMCSNMEEVNLLYSQLDPSISSRSVANTLLPYIIGFGVGLRPSKVSPILSSVLFARKGHVGRPTTEDRVFALHNSLPFLYWLEDDVFTVYGRELDRFLRVCTGAAIYATWLANPPKAAEFWKRSIYVGDRDYKQNDPCLLLNREIISSKAPHGETDHLEAREQFSYCVLAWNAFCSGGALKAFRLSRGKPIPRMRGLSERKMVELKIFEYTV